MNEEFAKMFQESMKPVLNLAQANTDAMVKLLKTQSEAAAELMEGNLAHIQALSKVEEPQAAVELQQKYMETLTEKFGSVAKENAAVIEAAVTEASKVFESSVVDFQEQTKKAAAKIEENLKKAS